MDHNSQEEVRIEEGLFEGSRGLLRDYMRAVGGCCLWPLCIRRGPQMEKINLRNILRLCRHLASETFIIFSQNLPGNNFTIRSYFCHIKLPQRKLCTRNQFLTLNHFFRIAPPYPPPQSSQTFWFNIFPWRPKVCFPCLWILIWKETRIGWRNSTQKLISRN